MTLERLIAHYDTEIVRLQAMRAALTKSGSAMRSRWGTSGPFTDNTRWWLAEIERRIVDLTKLNAVIRSGGLLSFRQA